MKKIKRSIFIGALVFALGLSAIASPAVGLAQTNINVSKGLGLGLGQYFAGSMRDTVASTLGITTDELYSLRLSGKSVAQIGEEKGFTSDQLLTVFVNAKTEQVEQLYKDGTITEAQKDLILNQLEARMEYNINKTTVGGKGYGKGNRYNTSTDGSTFVPGQGRGAGGGGWYNTSN